MFSLTQFPLQFSESALAPHMSAQTLNCHHGKHLATYISNLNELIPDTQYADMGRNRFAYRQQSVGARFPTQARACCRGYGDG